MGNYSGRYDYQNYTLPCPVYSSQDKLTELCEECKVFSTPEIGDDILHVLESKNAGESVFIRVLNNIGISLH